MFRRASSVTEDDKEGRKWAKAQGEKKDLLKKKASQCTDTSWLWSTFWRGELHKDYMEQNPQKL